MDQALLATDLVARAAVGGPMAREAHTTKTCSYGGIGEVEDSDFLFLFSPPSGL